MIMNPLNLKKKRKTLLSIDQSRTISINNHQTLTLRSILNSDSISHLHSHSGRTLNRSSQTYTSSPPSGFFSALPITSRKIHTNYINYHQRLFPHHNHFYLHPTYQQFFFRPIQTLPSLSYHHSIFSNSPIILTDNHNSSSELSKPNKLLEFRSDDTQEEGSSKMSTKVFFSRKIPSLKNRFSTLSLSSSNKKSKLKDQARKGLSLEDDDGRLTNDDEVLRSPNSTRVLSIEEHSNNSRNEGEEDETTRRGIEQEEEDLEDETLVVQDETLTQSNYLSITNKINIIKGKNSVSDDLQPTKPQPSEEGEGLGGDLKKTLIKLNGKPIGDGDEDTIRSSPEKKSQIQIQSDKDSINKLESSRLEKNDRNNFSGSTVNNDQNRPQEHSDSSHEPNQRNEGTEGETGLNRNGDEIEGVEGLEKSSKKHQNKLKKKRRRRNFTSKSKVRTNVKFKTSLPNNIDSYNQTPNNLNSSRIRSRKNSAVKRSYSTYNKKNKKKEEGEGGEGEGGRGASSKRKGDSTRTNSFIKILSPSFIVRENEEKIKNDRRLSNTRNPYHFIPTDPLWQIKTGIVNDEIQQVEQRDGSNLNDGSQDLGQISDDYIKNKRFSKDKSKSKKDGDKGKGKLKEDFFFKKPRYPIVLIHGLFGFDKIGKIEYWRGVKRALENVGVEVYIAKVPATASIEERAKKLMKFIENRLPGRKVNLIGHSMGGLDCRYLISTLKPKTFQVVSLTTITTPHRGCSFADFLLLDVIGQKNVPKLTKFSRFIKLPGGGEAFEELTQRNMKSFNELNLDDPDVSYFSYGAYFKPDLSRFFRISWKIVKDREGDNDGLVSIESSQWGDYQGTLSNVHHLDVVGWTAKLRTAYTKITGKPAFDVTSFYLDVVEGIAFNGF